MINRFLELLQAEGLQDEYVAKVTEAKALPQAWMDSVEPYQYVFDAFPGSRLGKWGALHKKWYVIVKETEDAMPAL